MYPFESAKKNKYIKAPAPTVSFLLLASICNAISSVFQKPGWGYILLIHKLTRYRLPQSTGSRFRRPGSLSPVQRKRNTSHGDVRSAAAVSAGSLKFGWKSWKNRATNCAQLRQPPVQHTPNTCSQGNKHGAVDMGHKPQIAASSEHPWLRSEGGGAWQLL